ncbi:hypothetical protein IX83_05580 [Basilea psittacipulmonis DSM 24701]|uniref:DNA-3-methyladenine glycosylase II n=1 Tax=Basilea psittacipulmonis DSM 24701 TaxID=1072685 RepID=A0A077DH98_9BURK|nr:hypothetical protein IX83_05580 [Basilea psittacipulmonis DSM 24701]
MAFEDYWTKAVVDLKQADKILGKIISLNEKKLPQKQMDAFSTLARSIVAQQISTKTANKIWSNFERELCQRQVEPSVVLKLSEQALKGIGIGTRKVVYLKDLAIYFQNEWVTPSHWSKMSDDEIVKQLCAIKGIGPWTAQIFLMMFLQRPNVLPIVDLGLKKAIEKHYFGGETVTPAVMKNLAQAWQPWCTVATWYLWKSLELDQTE